jgi:cation:H+ antiporter
MDQLSLGLLGAAMGGELFLRGVLATARRYCLPPAFVGATLAAFGTSAPELGVSTLAALEDAPQLGLGDVLGANVVNIGLVFGLTLLLGSLRAPRAENLRRTVLLVAAALIHPIEAGVGEGLARPGDGSAAFWRPRPHARPAAACGLRLLTWPC